MPLGGDLVGNLNERRTTHAHGQSRDHQGEVAGVQHQQLAKKAFADAGQRPNTFRFLPSSPLDVIGRLAAESYDLAVAECAVEEIQPLVEQTLPALRVGGVLIVLDTLLDGLVADDERTDRQTNQARQADEAIRFLESARVARLPLGAGATIITKVG